jgi:hypothetical protein
MSEEFRMLQSSMLVYALSHLMEKGEEKIKKRRDKSP